jgi:hypothetical protein
MFHLFQLYVANVSSLCFKSRSGVRGRPGVAAGAPSWFRAGTGARSQTLARDAGERGAWDAMRAGVGCRRVAPSRQTPPPKRDLAQGRRKFHALGVGVGAASRQTLRSRLRALVVPFFFFDRRPLF